MKILANICLCLLAALLLFVFGVNAAVRINEIVCRIVW